MSDERAIRDGAQKAVSNWLLNNGSPGIIEGLIRDGAAAAALDYMQRHPDEMHAAIQAGAREAVAGFLTEHGDAIIKMGIDGVVDAIAEAIDDEPEEF